MSTMGRSAARPLMAIIIFLCIIHGPTMAVTQTTPPTNISAKATGFLSAEVSWIPVAYTVDDGYYEVGYSTRPGGPYEFSSDNRTLGKASSSLTVNGIYATLPCYFVVRTVTVMSDQSTVTSDLSPEVALTLPARDKQADDGSLVVLEDYIVTAQFADCFYIERYDRTWGIRVEGNCGGASRVDLIGTLFTNADGERCVNLDSLEPVVAPPPPPDGGSSGGVSAMAFYMPNRVLAGASSHYDPATGTGQRGIDGGIGLNNIGLLVKTTGRVVAAGANWIYIDDGSRLDDGSGTKGLYVDTSKRPGLSVGATVWVTGISSCRRFNGRTVNILLATDGGVITPS